MAQSRLSTAISDGLLVLPDGAVSLVRPAADYDAAPLAGHDLQIVQGFYPDAAAWQQAGYTVTQTMTQSPSAIVVAPRAKALGQALIAESCTKAGLIIVDGQRTDGIDSLFKACRQRLGDLPSVTKAHGRIFWFPATDAFADWAAGPPARGAHGYFTAAGVFSDGAVDAGSALLADALPAKLPSRMADLGAGWGYLSAAVLARKGVTSVDLIEAEAASLDCAKLNVTDPRAAFHWADARQFTAKPAYDGIVMNPPFHTGRAADAGLGRSFIVAASRLLAGHGSLWMVANRHLPYETTLSECFRNVDMIGGNAAFKLFCASKPRRP
jgi:16S rRNA (guanine1207-N2)-methyltransferase